MNNTEIKINLMPDDSEIIPYNSTGIPIYLRSGWLSMYANMRSLCHICRNKCCQIFKRYTNQSPIEFLNQYRLEISRNLLENKELSILEIAQYCGFNHSSYYSKLFYRSYHCTPTEYRGRLRL